MGCQGVREQRAAARPRVDQSDAAQEGGERGGAGPESQPAVRRRAGPAGTSRSSGRWSRARAGSRCADLDRFASFPWRHDGEHTVADMAAWVNAELLKSVAEIGRLRLLRAARAASAD
ncbi:hypothetical protein GCM10010358_71290 [Streptomyces minutiscleroticus]|uniref:Uncharacterized protein n=1 Tax=Streptomyces minutiscleroticus TaxID=68238 RepID=A0A918NZJ5_9ACTN|nr:hypothetical protein GCM10010358_71290 [Streptomyces minutiscleroticus]